MTRILHLDASPRGAASVTRRLTAAAVDRLRLTQVDPSVVYRDLAADPPPHIGAAFVGAAEGPADATRESVRLVAELFACDVLVIGAPMYNFGLPSSLKAWLDHVVRAGTTFHYAENGISIGLVTGKRAIVAVASGGVYESGSMAPYDHVAPALVQLLGLIGIDDVTIVRAERQGMGDEAAEASVQAALDEIRFVIS